MKNITHKSIVLSGCFFLFFLPLLRAQTVVVTDDSTYLTGQSSAVLELKSTTKGFLPPRISSAQKLAIVSPVAGLLVYQTDGTSGYYLWTGTRWDPLVSGTPISATNGGTGQTTYTIGDILYARNTISLSKLAAVATGNTLVSGGVATEPSWGKIGLSTHVSGILAPQNGGTGVANNNTISIAGNINTASSFTTSGINPLTLITTGTTSVTLPLSGTLISSNDTTNMLNRAIRENVLDTIFYIKASITLNIPARIKSIVVHVIGAGGQGGGAVNHNGVAGGGGGSGGYAMARIVNPNAAYIIAIGIGGSGAGVTVNGNPGTGNTTFSTITVGPGGGGIVGTDNRDNNGAWAGGAGGTAVGGDLTVPGQSGLTGFRFADKIEAGASGMGGSTQFGSGGASVAGVSANGNAGTGYGAGGSGGHTNHAGGAGTNGIVIVYCYR